MYERRGDKSFIYYYDGSSTPYAVRYRSSESSTGAIYYYERNWRGDVTGLYNSSGVKHASYEYDVWGNVTSITDANGTEVSGSTKIAILNPFRYRGYYYDTDMGLYYLQSRYYDSVTHRFINADGLISTGQGILGNNMFAYCGNNPVMYADPSGDCFYNANGVWCHDNWEYLYGYVMQPEPTQDSTIDSYSLYSQHRKKGTTNPSNKNKHQKGQARKQRDNGAEKGDARRRGNPNKRKSQNSEIYSPDLGDRIWSGVVALGATVSAVYLVANDFTGAGALDDAAVVPTIKVIWDNLSIVFA